MRRWLLVLLLSAVVALAAVHAAPSPAAAQGPPDQPGRPLVRGGRAHIFPIKGSGVAGATGSAAIAGGCYPGCSPPLAYHGGPVMPASSTYAIFWLPSRKHYEPSGNDSGFENLIARYFKDVGSSSFYNILSEYSQDPATGATVAGGPIQNSSTFSGSWIDSGSYGGKGTTANPLLDSDIQAEVTRAINANGWTPGPTAMFFVFTGLDVQSCIDATHSTCTFTSQAQYCAYHGFGDGVNAPSSVIYANMPDISACASLLPVSPNGDVYADSVINVTSHEHFEAVTDPIISAWYDNGPYGYEIGDECAWTFGSYASAGNLTLNGHPYILQEEWSNASAACALSFVPSVPGAPTAVSAAPGNAQATVSWTAPTSNGGSPVTAYTVTSSPAGITAAAQGNATSAVVSGLTNGTSYTFTIHASNAIGSSGESAPSNIVTPSAAPPMTVSGMVSGGNLCTCNVLIALVGGTICTSSLALGYNASFTLPVACGTSGQALTFTVNGASAGLQTPAGATCLAFSPGSTASGTYVFPNKAANTTCATVAGVPTAPSAPTGVTAVAGNAQATISWAAPANNGGSTVTGYTVTSSPLGITAPVAGSATSAVVSGLTNGTSYTFTVTATNSIGTGPASAASNAVTPSAPTVPAVPTAVSATAGDAQATVSWTAPASNGGSAITGYTVTSAPGGLTATASASATSIAVTGLTNGTAYTFTVHANNAVGNSAESTPSNAVTPSSTPPMTLSGMVSGGNLCTCNVLVASVGGTACTNSPTLGYNASFKLSVACGVAGQALTFTVNGAPAGLQTPAGATCLVFSPGTTASGIYVFPNKAANTSCATVQGPPAVPGAPTGVTATAGNAQATINWTAPASNGGSPVTGYTVTTYTGGVAQPTVTIAPAAANSAVVSGLANGTAYTFTVDASNTIGTSAESSPSNAVTPSSTLPMTVSGMISGGNLCTCNTIVASVGGLGCTSASSLGYNASFSLTVSCGTSGQALTFTVNGAPAGLQTQAGATCLAYSPGATISSLYVFTNQPPNTSCATASASRLSRAYRDP